MTNFLYKINGFVILFGLFLCINGNLHKYINLQHRRTHLPQVKFQNEDYEDQETDETQQIRENWSGEVQKKNEEEKIINNVSNFDKNIKIQENWTSVSDLGQLSAVDIDNSGNIAIFSRGKRVWGQRTFTNDDRFDRRKGPILENVITLINKEGKRLLKWGKNTFYLPHGLTIDKNGDYWTTDVALHMVLKFDGSEISKNLEKLESERLSPSTNIISTADDLFANSIVKPSMVLGVPFEPGNDNQRFCKPTAVAVMENGDFFVSDGYCNSRVIKFNNNGVRITQFGRTSQPGFNQQPSPYAFFVPHALAVDEKRGYLYVADRENGRILCFFSENGTFHREYKDAAVGNKVYSIAHAGNRIYAVNGRDFEVNYHVQGFAIDADSGKIDSVFGPEGFMKGPHDIAVSRDSREIYVVELDDHVVYKFLQDVGHFKSKNIPQSNATQNNVFRKEYVPLMSTSNDDGPEKNGKITIIFTIMISSMVFIGFCVAVAAVVARCQKRGCLLSVRKKSYWNNDKNENFKLSKLIESRTSKKGFRLFDKRPNKKEFSKLNTEPETSDDERGEDSLII